MTLGGKLSILVALVWGASPLLIFLLSESLDYRVLRRLFEFVFMTFCFPAALFSGILHTGPASTGEYVAFFLLMVPNCFLIGYTLSAFWALVSGDGP